MIRNIEIAYEGESVSITYYDRGEVVEQTVFENEPLTIARSIRAVLLCDVIKRAMRKHPLLTGALPAPAVVKAQLDQLILDTFKTIEGDEYDELCTYAIDTLNELRRT